jgi:hypothetical protein
VAAVPSPAYVTLVADTDTTVELSSNAGAVEVSLIANAATTVFNTTNTAIASSSPVNGQHVVTASLPSKTVKDESGGNTTVVHLRSSGTPTVCVAGL